MIQCEVYSHLMKGHLFSSMYVAGMTHIRYADSLWRIERVVWDNDTDDLELYVSRDTE